MARLANGYHEEDFLDWEYLDGGADEEYARILMEEFDLPEDEEDENEDAWLDAELDCYGDEV